MIEEVISYFDDYDIITEKYQDNKVKIKVGAYSLYFIVDTLYNMGKEDAVKYVVHYYKFFEIDMENLILHQISNVSDNVDKLSLRILKRFLNLFSIHESIKFSSTLETALQYSVLENIINGYDVNKVERFTDISSLIIDLDTIWKIKA